MHPIQRSMSRRIVPAALLLTMVACGPSAPFTTYDPPPGYAFKHVAAYPALTAKYAGSTVTGHFLANVVQSQFVPTGSRFEFPNTVALFGRWTTVNFTYWPARWRFVATAGCGQFTFADISIYHKIFETVCTPVPKTPGISPPTVSPDSPGSVTVTFNPAEVPAWTQVEVWIVDPDAQAVMSSTSGQLDGNASIQVPTPALAAGEYRVLVDINLGDGDSGDASLVVGSGGATGRWKSDGNGGCYWDPNDSGPDQCSPPTGRWKSDGNGGCYWDPNDSGPDQCTPAVSFARAREGLPPEWTVPFGMAPATTVPRSQERSRRQPGRFTLTR